MDVKCPVCGERQLGDNLGDLELALQEHLADAHLMATEGRWEPSLRCPLCGMAVEGRDQEDLSGGLRDHFLEAHDMEPSKISLSE
jgi:hypothetical protein